eukprot:jgi/Mesvir1/29150/Mv25113-RA.1
MIAIGGLCISSPAISPTSLKSSRLLGIASWSRRKLVAKLLPSFSFSAKCSTESASSALRLTRREWLMPKPDTRIDVINIRTAEAASGAGSGPSADACGGSTASIYVIRDDLLHPLLGGNKLRKLDCLVPQLEALGVTEVVTCGGCQSAHTAAVAAVCAERPSAMRCHLLLRGERPQVPTGYNLVAGMFAHRVRYVTRSVYADRDAMFAAYVRDLVGQGGGGGGAREGSRSIGDVSGHVTSSGNRGSKDHESSRNSSSGKCQLDASKLPTNELGTLQVHSSADGSIRAAVVPEGAGTAAALLGMIRLVDFLAHDTRRGLPRTRELRYRVVIDSGTGTTAVGFALGVHLFRLPWTVVGVMLAGTEEYYLRQQRELVAEWRRCYASDRMTDPLEAERSDGDASRAHAANAITTHSDEPYIPGTHDHFHIDDAGAKHMDRHAVAGNASSSGGEACRGGEDALPLEWVPRRRPRRFGKVLPGEVAACARVAQATGVLLDPIYTLAGFEVAAEMAIGGLVTAGTDVGGGSETTSLDALQFSISPDISEQSLVVDSGKVQNRSNAADCQARPVVMLHTGGTLGLFGLAQRFPEWF